MVKQRPEQIEEMPAHEFVAAWQKATSLRAFCEATGYEPKAASQRATRLRNPADGGTPVDLRRFPAGGGRRLDRAALARLARRLAP